MRLFECKMCGDCCYGEGGICVEEDEIAQISFFLGMDREPFITGYCYERHDRYNLKTGKDGFCIFYHKDKNCLIHPVKPTICSLWPFFPANLRDKVSWEMAREACPGMNQDISFEDFVQYYYENNIEQE